jgi:hypothetical protein
MGVIEPLKNDPFFMLHIYQSASIVLYVRSPQAKEQTMFNIMKINDYTKTEEIVETVNTLDEANTRCRELEGQGRVYVYYMARRANPAEALAKTTGASSVTYTQERRNADGTLTVESVDTYNKAGK